MLVAAFSGSMPRSRSFSRSDPMFSEAGGGTGWQNEKPKEEAGKDGNQGHSQSQVGDVAQERIWAYCYLSIKEELKVQQTRDEKGQVRQVLVEEEIFADRSAHTTLPIPTPPTRPYLIAKNGR